MEQEMILLRGLPGAGKTEFARMHLERLPDFQVVEADDWFVDIEGEYFFIPSELPDAHRDCQERAEEFLQRGKTVVVSNTFSQKWEMQPYIDMAKSHGVKLRILTMHGEHGNVHDVPESVIQRMKARWEADPIL